MGHLHCAVAKASVQHFRLHDFVLLVYSVAMNFRRATGADTSLLAALNHQLIRDEGHRNRLTIDELERRMRQWLETEYSAVLFEEDVNVVAYALYREQAEEIYLRQFFVAPEYRRKGVGRKAMETLRSRIWPGNKRLTVEVLAPNTAAIAFWRAVGYKDYALTLEIAP
jgi:ribosomal protein S18 acetylase RimI-like enzyme